ncbi:MAG: hypothetical protein JSS78_06525 [Bacteroidetes bacterium]|nr:hypothetical protein [Bacteroidota bacterium]
MKILIFIFLFFLATTAFSAVPYVIERSFKNCLDRRFAEKEFKQFYHTLDSLERISVDFSEFKSYKIYTDNIGKLLNSTNYYQKGIAYRLVASLGDKEYNALLLERMNVEDNKFLKTLNVAAIMKLLPTQTTIAFDYLVDMNDFSNSPLLPLYLSMNEQSIIRTGYERIQDKRPRAKVFALQTLARFDTNKKVESLIVQALKEWEAGIKGYAVVALGVYKKGGYKDILAPYLKEPQLREVIIETLEHSESNADVIYAEELKRKRR